MLNFLFLRTQFSFTSKHPSLKEIAFNNMFSSQAWNIYKPIIIQNIQQLKYFFENRTFEDISFIGIPLQGS